MTNEELIAKIKAEIERLYNGEAPKHDPQCDFDDGYFTGISKVFDVIDSLQQEQDIKSELKEEKIESSPVIKEFISKFFEIGRAYNFGFGPKDFLQEQPYSSNGKFVFPNFLYARTVDNKTIDVSYAPQSLDAVEYIKNDPTEQPEVDSEKPMNPEDAMKELNEKIALVKQRGTWDGVDVDKYMNEVRGREPEKPMNQDGLEEEISKSIENLEGCTTKVGGAPEYHLINDEELREFARHFAQWGAEHLKK